MAVGDDAQSIYAFRGANVRNILDFKSFFPTARLIRLEENYRSTQPILDVANGVLSQSRENFAKNLYSNKKDGFMPRLVRPMSDRRQAEIIALRIEKLLEEYNPGEIAVLFRAGYQSYHLEVALAKRNLRFRKYGGLRYAEAAHIKDVLAYARLVVNPLDRPSLLRIADMSRGVGSKTAHKIFELLRVGDTEKINGMCAKYAELSNDLALLESLRKSNLQPAALLDEICSHYQPRLELAHPEDWPRRLQGIEELSHIASAYSDLEQFIADLSLESPEEDQENDGIVLSTIHSAKGLEWDAVLLIDLVEDRFPSRHALARPEDYEEERRLMYVAITRARQILELYVPLTIYSKATGSSERASDSPFVRDLSAWLYEEWQENYNGALQRRDIQATNFRPKPAQTVPSQINANTPVDEEPIFFKNEKLEYGFCHHKIFGRGKIVEHIPPDKCRVNFFGIGLKVIIASYLTMEE
jgi:DNA helicase-2/ATP-dependent DNA helicase PcrA